RDDYRSPLGREYAIRGEVALSLQGSDASDERVVAVEAAGVADTVAAAVDALFHQHWTEERRGNEAGIIVMMRFASTATRAPYQATAEGWSVPFYAEFAAPLDFLDRFPVRRDGERAFFDVDVEVQGQTQ